MQTKSTAHLGGATLDNEENYLIKKLFTGGLRDRMHLQSGPYIDTAPGCPVWAQLMDAAGQRRLPKDLLNSDAILIMGSNMAENHPVGFQMGDGGQGAARSKGYSGGPALQSDVRSGEYLGVR